MPYFSNSTIRTITRVADDAGIEPAVLLAVCEVESGGLAFAQIDDRKEPVIRFEGHYFDRRLHGSKREAARVSGLAHPKAGAVKNPRTQAGRWHLLTKARAIDDHAALESVSWGIGQVMGAHWKTLGYASVEHLVREARSGVAGQVRLMLRFIEHHGLEHLLKRRDWAGFARRYNGPGYARNAYDTKMAKAYARHLKVMRQSATAPTLASPWLKVGARGEAVRTLQLRLTALGYPLHADGQFGVATREAVAAYQNDRGLLADGLYGPQTAQSLDQQFAGQSAAPPPWLRRFITRFKRWFPVVAWFAGAKRWTRRQGRRTRRAD